MANRLTAEALLRDVATERHSQTAGSGAACAAAAGQATPSEAFVRIDPAAFTVEMAEAFSGIHRSRIYLLAAHGRLDLRKCGRQTLVMADSLRALLASLPPAQIRTAKEG